MYLVKGGGNWAARRIRTGYDVKTEKQGSRGNLCQKICTLGRGRGGRAEREKLGKVLRQDKGTTGEGKEREQARERKGSTREPIEIKREEGEASTRKIELTGTKR